MNFFDLKKKNIANIKFCLAFIGQPAFKKMGAKQGYSILNGLSFLPLCFFCINAFLLSVIAIVSVNPIIVSIDGEKNTDEKFLFFFFEDLHWSCHLC